MSETRGEAYRLVDGCWNCAHRITTWEYDDPNYHWCGFNAPQRPPCGSVGMDECQQFNFPDMSVEDFDKAWEDWSKNRGVMMYGICDDFQKLQEPRP